MTGSLPFPPEAIVLHDGLRFQVAGRDHGSDTLVLTFAERKEPKPADFFGLGFCDKERLSWIAVRSLENDWYLGSEMEQVFDAIRAGLARIGYGRLVMFGYSMGSFGVIRSANLFSPDRIILGGPVAQLDPAVERRWLSDYRHLLPSYETATAAILPWKAAFDTVVIFDPNSEDALHVSALEPIARVQKLEIPGAGHMVLTYLRSAGVLGTVMRMLLQPRIDLLAITALIHKARKGNRTYLLALAEQLARRPLLQQKVLDHAARVLPEDWEVLLARAAGMAGRGDVEAAAEIIRKVVNSYGPRCFGVALGKAAYAFAIAGGKPEQISGVVDLFSGPRPRSREVQLWHARFLRATGEYDAAFAAHEMFMTGDPFEAHAHVERGLILETFGLWRGARDCFRRAHQLAPRFQPAEQHLRRAERRITAMSKGTA